MTMTYDITNQALVVRRIERTRTKLYKSKPPHTREEEVNFWGTHDCVDDCESCRVEESIRVETKLLKSERAKLRRMLDAWLRIEEEAV